MVATFKALMTSIYIRARISLLRLRLTVQPRVPVFGFSPATCTVKACLRQLKSFSNRAFNLEGNSRAHGVAARGVKRAGGGQLTGFDLDWSVVAWLFSSRAALPALCMRRRNSISDQPFGVLESQPTAQMREGTVAGAYGPRSEPNNVQVERD